jgi:protein-S-isoprenylcysteine O-methyltransferase Ste14
MEKMKLLIKQLTGTFVFFLILFISAGRLDYWQGWAYVAIGLIMLFVSLTVLRVDPELMKERSKPGEGVKKWDKLLLILSGLMLLATYVTAGLDSGRFHWSPDFHWSLYALGTVLTVTGQLLFLIAQKQNRFFSSVVRIQIERGHVVYEGGLYKLVRHPAYLGSLIQTLAFPLFFGSVWSMIPVFISIIILLIRTYLEDKTLINELSGYREYTGKTRCRLIPYIW